MAGIRFIIPVKPENLLVESTRNSNIYTIKSADLTPSELSGALVNVERSFPNDIEDPAQFVWDNFDLFFSCSRKFESLEPSARKRFRDLIVKTLIKFVRSLEAIFPPGQHHSSTHQPGAADLSQESHNSSQDSLANENVAASRGSVQLTPTEKLAYCNALKMLVWVVSQIVELFEDQAQSAKFFAKGKTDYGGTGGGSDSGRSRGGGGASGRNKPAEDLVSWDIDKERIAERLVMLYTQFPINRLFTPSMIEEDFVQLLTKIAYKMLESHETIKSRPHLKEHVFSLLGTAVAKNKQGLSLCVRIIQLLQRNEKLPEILAQLVATIVDTHQEKAIVRDIISEIDRIEIKELSRDSSGPRAIAEFMCALSDKIPSQFVPHIHLMYPFLEQDSYQLRNATLTVFGNVVQKLRELGGDAPESHIKSLRDTLLEKLEDHIHDVTGYVRSHTLQVWCKLCSNFDAVPRGRYQTVVEATIGRLNDKVCQVRKSATQLLNTILRNSPYGNNVNLIYLKNLRKETKDKLDKMMAENEALRLSQSGSQTTSSSEPSGESTENGTTAETCTVSETPTDSSADEPMSTAETSTSQENGSSSGTQQTVTASTEETSSSAVSPDEHANVNPEDMPELHKLQILDKHFQEAVLFAEMITNAMPSVANLLNATNLSDTQEAIKFFVTAHQFRLDGTAKCIRKIISLIWSSEEKVRNEAFNAYKEIYFSNQDGSSAKEHAKVVVESLTELIVSATIGDMASLEEFVRRLVECGEISKEVKDITWQVYTMKRPGTSLDEVRAAASLLSMYGTSDWKFISDNVDIFIRCGLSPLPATTSCSSAAGKFDSRLVRETCSALTKVAPLKFKAEDKYPPFRMPQDDALFTKLTDILLDRIHDLDDHHFYSMADEIFKVIFRLAEHPDLICEQIIRRAIREVVNKAKEDLVNDPTQGADSQSTISSSTQQSSQQAASSILTSTTLATGTDETHGASQRTRRDPLIPHGQSPYIDGEVFTRFIIMLGDLALNMLIHIEQNIAIELKVRNLLREEKENRKGSKTNGKTPAKTPSRSRVSRGPNDSAVEDEMLGGANAISMEDTQMEHLQRICREEIVTGNVNLLAKFSPMLIDIARDSLTYSDVKLRAAATLTLGKFMVVSEAFCTQKLPPIGGSKKEEGTNLQLLFTILEKCKEPMIKCNTIIGLSDLCGRFSNLLDPWTPRLFQLIQDKDVAVRKTALLALARLVVSDQLKPRKFGSQMARLIVDSDPMVVGYSKQVFKQLKSKESGKSATIYNMIPDIVANLCGHKSTNRLDDEADAHIVMDFLFEMITRDHEKESLIRTLCGRIKDTTDEREVRDMTYCLQLMTYSQRGFKLLIEFTPTLATHLTCDSVYEHINKIIEQVKNNKNVYNTQEMKDLVEQFDADVRKIREFKEHDPKALLDESEIHALGIVSHASPKIAKRPPPRSASTAKKSRPAPPPAKSTKTTRGAAPSSRRKAKESSEEEDDDDEDDDETDDSSQEDEEEEEFEKRPKLRKPETNTRSQRAASNRTRKPKFAFSDSEEEDDE